MSSQIQDLIANFEDKFDNEFNSAQKQPQVLPVSILQQEDQAEIHNNSQTPEVQDQQNAQVQTKKQVRVIEYYDVDREIAIDESQKEIQKVSDHSSSAKDQKQFEKDEQFQENRYRELSNKLQTALKKISSSKRVLQSSQVRSTEVLDRFEEYEKKKEKDLAHRKHQEQKKKYHGLKDRPQINKKSRQMANQLKQKPLYERYQKLVDQRKKKEDQNEELRRKKQEQKFQEYLEEYNSHIRIPENKRDTDQFFDDMQNWKQKLEKKREEKQSEKEKKQYQKYTFKPTINKTSQKLLNKKKRVPIHERQIQKSVVEDPELTFKPNLTKKRLK